MYCDHHRYKSTQIWQRILLTNNSLLHQKVYEAYPRSEDTKPLGFIWKKNSHRVGSTWQVVGIFRKVFIVYSANFIIYTCVYVT